MTAPLRPMLPAKLRDRGQGGSAIVRGPTSERGKSPWDVLIETALAGIGDG